MVSYPYILQPYSGPGSRYPCPQCGRKGRFVRYISTATGQHLAPHVGRCGRQVKCGYHFTPRQHFAQIPHSGGTPAYRPLPPPPAVSYTPQSTLQQTLHNYQHNHLVQYLRRVLGNPLTQKLVGLYHIGTHHRWPGATVFWQINHHHQIHGGKIMLYNPHTGKRVKQPYNHISWVHAGTRYHLQQCLFGQHLLPLYPHHPVALVESEKTALIGAAYLPHYLWLAVGSLSSLTNQKCSALAGRKVTLYPDLNGFNLWQQKANSLTVPQSVTVSPLLQQKAKPTAITQGYDLADYLLTQPLHAFTGVVNPPPPPPPPPPAAGYTLADMEHYFARLTGLPQGTVQLKPYLSVTNLPEQITNWLECCRLYQGKKLYSTYFSHLLQIRQWAEAGMPQAQAAVPFTMQVSR